MKHRGLAGRPRAGGGEPADRDGDETASEPRENASGDLAAVIARDWPADIMSLFFDSVWYLDQNPDVAVADIDPLVHFLDMGHREGRNPHPMFDSACYLARYSDVECSGASAFEHFMRHGAKEERAPSVHIVPSWYLARNPDVVAAGMCSYEHFLRFGLAEHRDPHPAFDSRYYLALNEDVAEAAMTPHRHFVLHGFREGRVAHELFDGDWYTERYSDVAAAGLFPFSHFYAYGMRENRSPHRLFDADWYRQRNPDSEEIGIGAFGHFQLVGMGEARDPGPLFDTDWYRSRYRDLIGDLPPLLHFLREGETSGCDPNPLFDNQWYRLRYPDILAAAVPAFEHFLKHGMKEGRSPHPFFQAHWYADQVSEIASTGEPSFYHFMRCGLEDGIAPSPFFDADWYLSRNEDVRSSGSSPLGHFIRFGLAEGRSPHPLFDPEWYAAIHADLNIGSREAVRHFIFEGADNHRDPHPLFDGTWYATFNSDFAQSDLNPFIHYLMYSECQGRDPCELFSVTHYKDTRPSDLPSEERTLLSYLKAGKAFTGDPTSLFDHRFYVERYGHLFADDVSPLMHYVGHPKLRTHPLFDPAFVTARLERAERRHPGVAPIALQRSPRPNHGTCVFTSIARNYLPFAKVLAESVKRHDPMLHVCIVLCDTLDGIDLEDCPHFDEVVSAATVIGKKFEGWAFGHSIVELCTAVKPFAFRHFLESGFDRVIYLDPDIATFSSLGIIVDELDEAPILLTPHLLEPENQLAAIGQNEVDTLRHGIFNLGFLAVRKSAVAARFLNWWAERLQNFCFDDQERGLFVDQKWMDLAPAFFPELGILRHPGCNVAPWNIGRRTLTGDLTRGFQADGQPLIFYHFSGFAKRAHHAMLERYAGAKSPAFLLQSYYETRTAVARAVERAPVEWAYAHFADGELIQPEHRRLYREDRGLQRRFPHPFSDEQESGKGFRQHLLRSGLPLASSFGSIGRTGRASDTVLARYREAVRGRCIATVASDIFDPGYYLAANPDVRASHVDPAIHFLQHGIEEGRKPSLNVDPDLIRIQLGLDSNRAVIELLLESGLPRDVRPSRLFSPKHDQRALSVLDKNRVHGVPTVLFVCHRGGGGTQKHIEDLTRHLKDRANILLLTPAQGATLKLDTGFTSMAPLYFDSIFGLDDLVALLDRREVNRVHVHHVMGMERVIGPLLTALNRPYDITLHDLYFLTPQIFFSQITDAGAPDISEQLDAVYDKRIGAALNDAESAMHWRELLAPALVNAERVIAPTHFVREVFARYYPNLPYHVVPHLEMATAGFPLHVDQGVTGLLTIAILGELYAHKGFMRVARIVMRATQRNMPLRFVLIGGSQDDALLRQSGAIVTGSYRDKDLAALMRDHEVETIWLPNEAAESYSYTLSAAIRSGLPIAANDVGCFSERLDGIPQAILLSPRSKDGAWLALFQRLHELVRNNLLGEPSYTIATSSFYDLEYIAPPQHIIPS